MKNSQKGFIVPLIIIIAVLVIGGGVYYWYSPFHNIGEPKIENIDGQTYQVQDYAPNWGQKGVRATSTQTQNNSQPLVTNIVGKCGLVINSPLVNSSVTFPLIIKGIIDSSSSKNLGCAWQMFEGVAGTAQFYIYLDEENYKGWKTIGDPVIMQLENGTANKANFTLTFNFSEGGFKINAPIKIIFTEENPAVIRPSLTFELPLVLK